MTLIFLSEFNERQCNRSQREAFTGEVFRKVHRGHWTFLVDGGRSMHDNQMAIEIIHNSLRTCSNLYY